MILKIQKLIRNFGDIKRQGLTVKEYILKTSFNILKSNSTRADIKQYQRQLNKCSKKNN